MRVLVSAVAILVIALSCARPASAQTPSAADLCAGAAVLRGDGEPKAARTALMKAATLPGGQCAAGQLKATTWALVKQMCAQAKTLDDNDDPKRAAAVYRDALALGDEPGGCATAGLKPEDKTVWDHVGDVITWIWDNKWWVLGGLALLALAFLALASPKVVRGVLARGRFKPYFAPRLAVTALGDAGLKDRLGPALTAQLQGQLQRARHTGPSPLRLDIVSSHTDLGELFKGLDSLGTEGKAAALLAGLADRLLPTQKLTLGGELLPATTRGAGLALAVHTGTGLDAAGELWEFAPPEVGAPPAPTSEPGRLAIPAAAWSQVVLARLLHPASPRHGNPGSVAAAAAGNAWLHEAQWAQARASYEEALIRDPANWEARGNLALAHARLGHFGAARAEAQRALDDLVKSVGAAE